MLDKAAAALNVAERMKSEYRRALASSYFHLARNYFDRDRKKYRETMEKVLMLEPEFQPSESAIYGLAKRMFGFSAAESLASWNRRLRARYSD